MAAEIEYAEELLGCWLKRGLRRNTVNELQEWEFKRRRDVAVPQGLRMLWRKS